MKIIISWGEILILGALLHSCPHLFGEWSHRERAAKGRARADQAAGQSLMFKRCQIVLKKKASFIQLFQIINEARLVSFFLHD